ncbi:copper chaperone PCu(A)C [Bailinhaonella thermotolerans]|uniref:Copper chaperone PCu(A)C n=1 Tax=Bailinhaonella thermotolerans TaxID=1070861 RepID=A0A3A4AXZ6_9ACTN|nr:copper chaperone PCu(A)C [Bailinhaonella thermotolerans]RJL30140.1 copper chaperone PCu(A)C [Bailinhaonella thermotolerans]
MFVRRTVSACLLAAAALTAVAGCGGSGDTAEPAAAPAAGSGSAAASASAPARAGLTITDPWVKTTKKGMTAAFGTLVNNSDAEITVLSGSSPLSPKVELHEVADVKGKMMMRPKEGGFVIPARGSHELKPGGDHIMLMGVTGAVEPGAQVPFTLTLKDGGKLEFTAIGKDFAGAKEDYQPGMKHEG